jgi:hypothetical protein
MLVAWSCNVIYNFTLNPASRQALVDMGAPLTLKLAADRKLPLWGQVVTTMAFANLTNSAINVSVALCM